MGGFTEQVKIVIDVVADKSASALGNLKSKMDEAEGGFGKLKAAGGSALSGLAANAPAAAAAAGAAVLGFAAKSIGAFQDTALAADKFRNATGLSIEESSKWIAVADDIGIGADTIQGAFVKLEKQLGTNKEAFAEYGVQVARNADGTTNLQQTLLNAIDAIQRIQDPTERAAASAKLFGKGYAEVAELINTKSSDIVKSFGEVSDAQIIDEGEVQKAKAYRAALDDLGDAAGDVQREIGERLVPTLTQLAAFSAKAIEITANLKINLPGNLTTDLGAAITSGGAEPFIKLGGVVTDVLKGIVSGSEDAGKKAATGFQAIATAAQNMGTAIGPAGNAVNDLSRTYDLAAQKTADATRAQLEFQDGMRDSAAAAKEADDALKSYADAQLAAFDSTFAVTKATDDFATAHMAAITASQDATLSSGQQRQAYDEETQAAEAAAVAIQKKAEDDAIASGKALTNAESNDVLISALQGMSAQASGPTKAALDTLIGTLQKTGEQHPTPTVSLNDQATQPIANIRGAARELDGLNPTLNVGANTSAAKNAVNALIDGLNALSGITGVRYRRLAQGTPNWQGGLALLGEHGPELAFLPQGSAVKTASQTQQIMSPSGGKAMAAVGSGTTIVNFNGALIGPDKASIGRWIDEALAASRRRGNRAG